jgi:hydroxysqualene dehydroxylase
MNRCVRSALRVAVIGGGWAGLAAAVRATEAGHRVTLFETSAQWGGRARTVDVARGPASVETATATAGSARSPAAASLPHAAGPDAPFDNGQHILIGAYARTLALMQTVGADPAVLLWRAPLQLRYPDGRGMAMPAGPPVPAFLRAVASCHGWTWGDRLALLAEATRWQLAGFRCDPALDAATLCRRLPPRVRTLLIDPLCVAALNTPAHEASAAVLLRVLRDALFGGPGSADLMLPRQPLGALLPEPAAAWLGARGAALHPGRRVVALERGDGGWRLSAGGGPAVEADAVVLACSPVEAARLAATLPDAAARLWAERAAALPYEPIVTVYLQWSGARLPAPMTALVEGPNAPAQFAFDHGAIGATPGRFAFVISGARRWVDAGLDATAAAVIAQAHGAFAQVGTRPEPTLLRVLAEKRATFRCVPGLDRPPPEVVPGLWAAGDYVQGPYPATLEGAVRAGESAAAALAGLR